MLGAGAGLGATLIVLGLRGVEVRRQIDKVIRARVERHTLRLGIAVGAAVLVGAATGWPVAAAPCRGGLLGRPGAVHRVEERQTATIARVEAVAGWAEMLRDTMAGAAGLEQAIAATATVAPPPIRRDVATLAARLERQRLGPALRAFADDVADPTCDLVVAALLLAAEHQASRLGELLGTLATAARDQATMRLRVEAGRARTRTSVKVIVGITLGLALFLAVLNHGYLAPYGSGVGQLVLLLVGGLFAAAFAWLAKMTRPAEPARFLVTAPSAVGGDTVIAALLCGAGVGAGLFLVARGIAPPRPTLAEALAQLRRTPEPPAMLTAQDSGGFAARVGRPLAEVLARAGAGVFIWPRVRRDLAVLGRSTRATPGREGHSGHRRAPARPRLRRAARVGRHDAPSGVAPLGIAGVRCGRLRAPRSGHPCRGRSTSP